MLQLPFIVFAPGAFQLSATSNRTFCSGALSNWSVLRKMPKPGIGTAARRAINVISVDEHGQLLWNGDSITEKQLGLYLGMVKQMGANSTLTALAADPRADCQFVTRIRSTINQVLSCDQGSCGEVDPTKVRALPSESPLDTFRNRVSGKTAVA